ncbi:unnamed protein product [Fusarium graminearum]|uniref:Chromosome 4, complete genome n=2 Tax=Gibberella zeae TaxID=5518 RepID=A0A0E0SGY7_GIBZE|nr:hypothetical protein FG05_30266 [Fusarium graminearum]CAF3529141.1 unnamed protein product [Fusarium graminearum]CAF3628614.1 unnamed protein product [Fusarium graminearum]CAG1961969.1 unnamed protein product [Fusarium graminearum]CAG1992930.1 unnamed protein product [Fusarium graminearum]
MTIYLHNTTATHHSMQYRNNNICPPSSSSSQPDKVPLFILDDRGNTTTFTLSETHSKSSEEILRIRGSNQCS